MRINAQSAIEEFWGIISATAVAAMMILTVIDVLLRAFADSYLAGSYEYVSLLFVLVVYLGLTLAQRDDEHISIDVLYAKLPRSLRKFTQACWLILLLALVAPLTVYSGISTWTNYQLGDTILGIKPVVTWPARLAIVIGLFTLSLRVMVQLVALVRFDELIEEAAERRRPTAKFAQDPQNKETDQ